MKACVIQGEMNIANPCVQKQELQKRPKWFQRKRNYRKLRRFCSFPLSKSSVITLLFPHETPTFPFTLLAVVLLWISCFVLSHPLLFYTRYFSRRYVKEWIMYAKNGLTREMDGWYCKADSENGGDTDDKRNTANNTYPKIMVNNLENLCCR